MLIVVTDLRLGAGDELEDFLRWGPELSGPPSHLRLKARLEMDAMFAAFLATKLAQAKTAGLVPTLLLLGDTFNFWQVQRRGEPPRRALQRILGAHVQVSAALAGWLEAGARIDLVVGPRDQPLVHPRAWGALREHFPGINRSNGGRPMHGWRDTGMNAVALPASAWNGWFRPRAPHLPQATCAARELLRRSLLAFEAMVPWIDKPATLAGLVRATQESLAPEGRAEVFRRVLPAIRWSGSLRAHFDPWERGRFVDWESIARREAAARNGAWQRMRRNLCLGPGCRVIAPGSMVAHTMLDPDTPAPPPRTTRGGIELVAPGPWSPMVRWHGIDGPRMEQPMEYAQLIPDGAGGWESSVRPWR